MPLGIQVIKNVRFNLLLLIYLWLDTVKKLHYYPFAVNLDLYVGSCNTLNDLSNKVCVTNEPEDLNLSVFNMITGINESKTLKHISCKYKCKYDACNSNKKRNNNKCWCDCKNHKKHCECKTHYIWNPATCTGENGKYLGSGTDNSVITCDEVMEEIKIIPANCNEKNNL